jgi:N-acyl amino acid synthase of PEP-CTERM/exosortase system
MRDTESLVNQFTRHFSVGIAVTRIQKEQVFEIRHQVYCEELGFEPLREDRQETDEYDACAIHCLLTHRASQQPAGCVRLLVAPPDNPRQPLPFERFCADSIDRRRIDPAALAPRSYGEISRLAVPSSFRRRASERSSSAPLPPQAPRPGAREERRAFPHIAMGLALAGAAMTTLSGLDYLFVVMEPRLARYLWSLGIKFHQGGDVTEYHGARAVFFVPSTELEQHLSGQVEELYRHIKAVVRQDLELDEVE